ncbi:formyltransferase family protein [Halobacteriovorax sp. JY17]|uniref:formyltransferase family protein n=1 Tax=Halobacteriovorax sp. JY17 TaxID=2014617 RepID=UPI0025C1C9D3|nr:formyltransferase family protein [Halobacteriovorax sp. JY17]
MKVVLVTSQLNYMPKNYSKTIEGILASSDGRITSLIEIENLDYSYIKSGLGLIFYGARNFGSQLLKNLIRARFSSKKSLCDKYEVEHRMFKSINNKEAVSYLNSEKFDLLINLRTRCIYKRKALESTRLGCLNIHHGLLPKYRGTMCDLNALSAGRSAGFSIHMMDEKIDNGDIIRVVEVSSSERDYFKYLEQTRDFEVDAIKELLDYISEHNSLPKGLVNKSEDSIYTKTPDISAVRDYIRKGMIL